MTRQRNDAMRTRHLVIAAALALLPGLAAGQQGDASARIDAAMHAAAAADVPVSLLESKVQEGRAKHVPEARIASAIETRLDALVRARHALGEARAEGVTAGELSLAADAVQAGVSETAVAAVMAGAPRERRAVATAVLTELVQAGVASDVALARVDAALAKGGQALLNLPAEAGAKSRGRGNAGGSVTTPGGVDVGAHGGADVQIRGGGSKGRGNNPSLVPLP